MVLMDRGKENYKFVRVHSISRADELGIVKSILDTNKIPYFIKGENFGTLYGPSNGLALMDVMVREDYSPQAKDLLTDLINPPE